MAVTPVWHAGETTRRPRSVASLLGAITIGPDPAPARGESRTAPGGPLLRPSLGATGRWGRKTQLATIRRSRDAGFWSGRSLGAMAPLETVGSVAAMLPF